MNRRTTLFCCVALLLASPAAWAWSWFPGQVKDDNGLSAQQKQEIKHLFADKIVVKKGERKLYLMRGDKPLRTYRIALGTRPEGHKERRGDGRTPEGRYTVDWRNASSNFRKALHISYPSFRDRSRARRNGDDPGGMIMIHGQPRSSRFNELQQSLTKEDWTQGCIAVSDIAIDEIWDYTMEGTPIEILP